jgi:hypothetical protein
LRRGAGFERLADLLSGRARQKAPPKRNAERQLQTAGRLLAVWPPSDGLRPVSDLGIEVDDALEISEQTEI